MKNFVEVLKKVQKCTGDYGVLANVLLKVYDETHIEFVATDGNMITIKRLDCDNIPKDFVGKKYLIQNIDRVIRVFDKQMVMFIDFKEDGIDFLQNDDVIPAKLDDAEYPKYEQLITGYNSKPEHAEPKIKIGISRELLKRLVDSTVKTKEDILCFDIKDSLSAIYIDNINKDIFDFTLLMPKKYRG